MSDLFDRLETALADRYAIERELGAGGMATVYLAEDLKHHRPVAVKVLRPELAAVLGAERFLREIEITARLTHPHILTLLDSGEVDGFLYYVMPYIEGESLRDRLNREKQLPLVDALQFAREVADALSYAHSLDVIHRDIKPENILLEAGHAVIADFGIARAVTAAGGDRLTETGVSIGTPHYMSPEQCEGASDIDGRTDIYALGSVLYELLAGEPPYTGPTAQAVIAKRLSEPVPHVSTLRETVPPTIEAAINKALAKAPADRYATASQLVDVLNAPTSTPTAESVIRSKPLAIVAVAAVAVIAVLVIGALLLPRSGVAVNPDRVVVAVLSNQTGDPSFDRVGYMAGDWITQGLQEAQVMQVVPWLTAQRSSMWVESEQQVGRVRDPLRALAAETGASVVISGAYYREGESIRLSIQINDALRGKLLVALKPVEGSADSVSGIVDRVRGSVMGSMAVLFDERFANWVGIAQQPPSPAAYREFSAGMERYIRRQYVDAAPHFQRAAELDPSFVQAPLYLALVLFNVNEYTRTDSVVQALDRRRDSMTTYDRLWLDGQRALLDGNHDAYLNFMRQAAEMAPGSKAVYNRGFAAVRANRPSEAVEAFMSLDPELGAMRGWNPYFRWLTIALHSLEEYERELDAAHRGAALYPGRDVTFRYRVRPLAALGRIEEALGLLR